ncbi:hypothetical protein BDZ94DRAFT_1246884 [Collybia nuda]|uniref:Chaperone DnaJ C-terminal domain-containing protein n=1 Tax=Collybia nuda TaxID=64659 RepID=A0A9P5YG31_9AGAR|nr:hypothetical protein BDZ94DRAFT_1246884 [Collybia nuda]
MVEFDIPPGCKTGSALLSGGIGHELPDGTLDDVSFILQEVPHERFTRVQDDLVLEIQIPWAEIFRSQPRKVYVRGIDGEDIFVFVDYSRDKNLIGSLSIRGAGMPIRERGKLVGRGNLIVNWEIIHAPTKISSIFWRFFRREA